MSARTNMSESDMTPEDVAEDRGYSKQFFTISRRGHTSATADCGSPTMVWHVAFWPRRKNDPFSVAMTREGKIKDGKEIIEEFGEARGAVIEDFNRFLWRLQARGRHPDAPGNKTPFVLTDPRDWDSETTEPFKVFDAEATGFTLWWPDHPLTNSGDGPPADPPKNVISDRPEKRPIRTDVRVRVQAEVSIDFSSVTFFIDAGKPWNESPIYLTREGEVPHDIGERRQTILKHVKNIKTICEERLEAVDHEGRRLIDLDLLPEPSPICGTAEIKPQLEFTDCAEALKAAADYLYEDVWKQFCDDFGFNLNSIAGNTDVVFASFRGLIVSTCGTEVTEHAGKLVRAPEPKDLAETAHPGSVTFPRFDGGGAGHASDKVEPNAVVKAYMPFMRRFRAEGDWRDWIACGIFDWRAIYIDAVGAQSEFAAFDEWDYDIAERRPGAIPAGYIPERRVKGAGNPDGAGGSVRSNVPTTAMNDRPAPFRFLLLTKFEPDRKQIGRMVERLNSLGTRRLFALKDWSVIQNASMWINHYGRQLDAAFEEWIRRTLALQEETRSTVADLEEKFWTAIRAEIDALANAEAENIRRLHAGNPRLACQKLRKLAMTYRETTPGPWDKLLRAVDDREEEYRTIDGDRDTRLAAINGDAGQELIKITEGLDRLGDGAVGGLPYRIARSSYYAKTFRDAQTYLRAGNIETWWSYEQFAKRGMEPVLRFIETVGERLDKLRTRLQTMKQDILQRSIALQTEATRDNTHRLEQIQHEIRRMANETQGLHLGVLQVMRDTGEIRKKTAESESQTAELKLKVTQLHQFQKRGDLLIHTIPMWIAVASGWAVAAWTYAAHLFK